MNDDFNPEEIQPEEPKFVPVPLKVVNKIPAHEDATLIVGGPGTGKTTQLVDCVAHLNAAQPDSRILVFCATPDSATAFNQRLAARGLERAAHALTPRGFALQILGDSNVKAATGRDARLLAPFEMKVLMEDLKVLGMEPKRLRQMFRFFFRSMTELADDDENWLINSEEETMFTRFKTLLAFTRGIAEPELVNLCVNYLRNKGPEAAGVAFDHVLVDDYQLLSRASQYLANLIALKSVHVAADPEQQAEVFESYPYLAGIDEFTEVNTDAKVIRLETRHGAAAVTKAINMIHADMAMVLEPLGLDDQAEAGEVRSEECATPLEEVKTIARLTRTAYEQGERVYVDCPNRTWQKNIAKALRAAGVPFGQTFDPKAFNGDARDPLKAAPARILTMLQLIANPFDCVAWRAWIGFGSYTANADGVDALLTEAGLQHMALDGMLDWASANDFTCGMPAADADLARIYDAYRYAITIISQAQHLPATELPTFVTAQLYGPEFAVPSAVISAFAPSTPSQSAAQVYLGTLDKMALPGFANQAAVLLGNAEQAQGLQADMVICAGFVNGLTPNNDYFDLSRVTKEEQLAMRTSTLRRLRSVLGIASQRIVFTWFSEVSLELASRANIKVERIRLRNGERVCRTSPSIFMGPLLKASEIL